MAFASSSLSGTRFLYGRVVVEMEGFGGAFIRSSFFLMVSFVLISIAFFIKRRTSQSINHHDMEDNGKPREWFAF